MGVEEHQTSRSGVSSFFTSFRRRSSAAHAASESTALASQQHSACILIDMGSYLLSECRNRAYTADDAALPCIAGEHVRQILPEALVERAALFPPFDQTSQVSLYLCRCAELPRPFPFVTPIFPFVLAPFPLVPLSLPS